MLIKIGYLLYKRVRLLTKLAPDLAKAAEKTAVRSRESGFENGGVLQTRQAGEAPVGQRINA